MNQDYTTVKKNRPLFLIELQKNEITIYFNNIFEVQKPFIQTKYNLSQLSQESGFSRNVISAFLNQEFDCCFNDYINIRRIKYCKELIAAGYANQFTLEGLAERCGFYNRNTFTTAFKKFTGVTPSHYIKEFSTSEAK